MVELSDVQILSVGSSSRKLVDANMFNVICAKSNFVGYVIVSSISRMDAMINHITLTNHLFCDGILSNILFEIH